MEKRSLSIGGHPRLAMDRPAELLPIPDTASSGHSLCRMVWTQPMSSLWKWWPRCRAWVQRWDKPLSVCEHPSRGRAEPGRGLGAGGAPGGERSAQAQRTVPSAAPLLENKPAPACSASPQGLPHGWHRLWPSPASPRCLPRFSITAQLKGVRPVAWKAPVKNSAAAL